MVRLPFFALVVSPGATGINEVKDLAGKKVGINNLGTTEHYLARSLLTRANVDPEKVEFVALGPNLYEQLLQVQVETGLVQESSLTPLLKAGGKGLVNLMDLKESRARLGGAYQFMALNTRSEVHEARTETARMLVRGIVKANRWVIDQPGARIVEAIPKDLVASASVDVFAEVLDKHKFDLNQPDGIIQTDAVQRVIDVRKASVALATDRAISAEDLFTTRLVGT